jgi:rhodanese-related sulfurtransferase
MAEDAFVDMLLADQPFVPKYFGGAVEINRVGAPHFQKSVERVMPILSVALLPAHALIVDTRPGDAFKAGHLPGAINIQEGGKFETWLGSIVGPDEPFTLVASTADIAAKLICRAAAIGYEKNILGWHATQILEGQVEAQIDPELFRANPDGYTIVDVRNRGEQAAGLLFKDALPIPLPELRERITEVPTHKPVLVHCAAGYRSAAAQSILSAQIQSIPVYDLGEAIKTF